MRAVPVPALPAGGPLRSRRLLALAGDERLVEQIRRGNEAAFEVAFERHSPAILGFCRHMLGSQHEAEDAVQQVFVAAYRDLQRDGDRDITLKPWLFAIARNRCVSIIRARRERPVGEPADLGGVSPGLGEQVEQRADLRLLLSDLHELPDEQRAALLLAELGDLSHAEVARVLGCEVPRVKALVYRARTALIAHREARETPCEQIREQLATLRRGSLRRTELRLHLRDCPGCSAYREQIKQQRRMLAVALPVAPTLGLKSSVLAAVGVGGGTAGGLTIGGATLAKLAIVGVVAGGGVVAGDAVIERAMKAQPPSAAEAPARSAPAPAEIVRDGAPTGLSRVVPPDEGTSRLSRGDRGRGAKGGPPEHAKGRPPAHAKEPGKPAHAGQPGPPSHSNGRGNGNGRANRDGRANGNGPPAHAKEPGPPAHAKEPGPPPHSQGRREPKAPKALPAPVVELPSAAPEVVDPPAGKAEGRGKNATE